ncbi:MAG: hypothetical protein HRU20_23860 [Pseudomonadales bacterium]|nr:hypothetical protein [Pseudomonadales bacterium]
MTEYEIHYLISDKIVYMQTMAEFWLTCSFGVVVATTFAKDKLSTIYVKVLAIGYLVSSVVMLLVRTNTAIHIGSLIEALEKSGHDIINYETNLGISSALGSYILYFGGIIGVLYYMYRVHEEIKCKK